MDNPTNSDLSRQIETVAQTVAEIYAKMTTKEELSEGLSSLRTEMNKRFDRIEKSYDYRITTLEHDVADLRT
jgi:phage host-nuclease inhibitor protein Gam